MGGIDYIFFNSTQFESTIPDLESTVNSSTLMFENDLPTIDHEAVAELLKRVYHLANPKPPERRVELDDYPELFKGLGCLPGMYHIQLADGATPVVHPPRKVPVPQREKVIEELKRMEKLGVIVRQEEPTEWVNSLVVVQKPNGAVRLCIDPRDINAAMKRSHYPMKTVDEVATHLQGANTFSILDAKSGFWQLKLDEESSRLCIFNTPIG